MHGVRTAPYLRIYGSTDLRAGCNRDGKVLQRILVAPPVREAWSCNPPRSLARPGRAGTQDLSRACNLPSPLRVY
jgi:hypothetical protein